MSRYLAKLSEFSVYIWRKSGTILQWGHGHVHLCPTCYWYSWSLWVCLWRSN